MLFDAVVNSALSVDAYASNEKSNRLLYFFFLAEMSHEMSNLNFIEKKKKKKYVLLLCGWCFKGLASKEGSDSLCTSPQSDLDLVCLSIYWQNGKTVKNMIGLCIKPSFCMTLYNNLDIAYQKYGINLTKHYSI